jgi:hypothetical protein
MLDVVALLDLRRHDSPLDRHLLEGVALVGRADDRPLRAVARTTSAVVMAIFGVIVISALFTMFFTLLGV